MTKKERLIKEIEKLELERQLLIDLVLDPNLSSGAKILLAFAIKDGKKPPTDETRAWHKLRCC